MKRRQEILLVEDEPETASLLKNFLSNQGYNTSISRDGKNNFPFYADATFDSNNPPHYDLVLLDKQLNSNVGGLEICRLIKTHLSTKDLPVIILSATIKSKEELATCKANDFIAKPFELSHLLGKISYYLRQKSDLG